MALVGSDYLNIVDKLRREDPDGSIADIVELLMQTNEVMQDATVIEGNTQTGNRTTMRAGLPTPTWRKLYGFTQPSKSTTVQVDDAAGILETFSFLDKDLGDMGGNLSALRLSEATAHLMAMSQEMAATLFYGNTDTSPEEFLGLAPRFDDPTADNGNQVVDGTPSDGSQTALGQTSLWLIKWDENYTYMFYPKGTQAGLQHTDQGIQTETNAAGGKRLGYQDNFKWKVGISVRDYRHIVRICNIDVADLQTIGEGTDKSADLINLMIEAMHNRMENLVGGRLAFYCDRVVYTALTKKAVAKANVNLTFEDFGGPNRVMAFQGIPVKRVDAIVQNEALITGF